MEINSTLITQYFPHISPQQLQAFTQLAPLYHQWNAQINVISRKDIHELYLRHVLHSLAIAKVCSFRTNEHVLDIGTGGGFPGIPLAILFPHTHFHLVDSIGKKIKVVQAVADELNLPNVTTSHARAEDVKGKYNFIVSRAVTQLKDFYPWCRGKIASQNLNAIPNGILYLKGGDLSAEIKEAGLKVQLFPIADFFPQEFFETKQVLYVPM